MTLIERHVWEKLGDHHEADDVVWGTAYRIPADKVVEVKEYSPDTIAGTSYGTDLS